MAGLAALAALGQAAPATPISAPAPAFDAADASGVSAASGASSTPGPSGSSGASFAFELPRAQTTSAAVYRTDGRLLRTLWRGEPLQAGRHQRSWDGRDDRGEAVPAGRYDIRLLAHNVSYHWDGVIGNSAWRAGAPTPHRAFLPPSSLTIEAGRLHYAVGYNEFQSGLNSFTLARPQAPTAAVQLVNPFVAAVMVTTDGQRLYWANSGGLGQRSFIAAFDLPGGQQARFAAGRPMCLNRRGDGSCYEGQFEPSVLQLRDDLRDPPTGLAVQARGRLLAVAHRAGGAVDLLDKGSGEWLRQVHVSPDQRVAQPPQQPQSPAQSTPRPAAINRIAFAPGGDLWVINGSSAERHTDLDTSARRVAVVTGLSQPLAIAVDPADDDQVWIADGGASQQLKRFDRQGRLTLTLGRLGGLRDAAELADDRLCFLHSTGMEQTAIAVDADHALWVVDTCSSRILKLDASGQLLDQIAYRPASYNAQVDTQVPSRVFSNFLEYRVNHSLPLNHAGAWLLVRNWLPAVRAALGPLAPDRPAENRAFAGFRSVQTLRNGRTYAVLQGERSDLQVLELGEQGQARLVRTLPRPAADETAPVLYENGDLGYAVTSRRRQTVMRRRLRGFDDRGDPQWAMLATAIAGAPLAAEVPTYPIGTMAGLAGPRFPVTDRGEVIFFNPAVTAASGLHLGAVEVGARDWCWQASPSGPMDGRGAFQTRRDDPGIQYGGNVVWAVGRDLVYGYHGEFYTELADGPFKGRVGQAHQFMHFRDDGLFIGQFGLPSTRLAGSLQAGAAGNAFSPTLVRVEGRLFLLHNDEWGFGGVHRWRIDGLETQHDLVGTLTTGSALEPAVQVELR